MAPQNASPSSRLRGCWNTQLFIATAGLSLLTANCTSEDPGTGNTGTAGTVSMSGSGGAGVQAGNGSGGSSAGMATGAGSSMGGSASGSGGAMAAGGGGAGGGASGGTSGGTGGAGGGAPTFTQVAELMQKSCAISKCHDGQSKQISWKTDGLYMRLTNPIPGNIEHCVGTTPVVPGNTAGSFLLTAIKGPGKVTCMDNGQSEMIARMPDDCPDDRPCLTDTEIKLVEDWIAAGAKM